MILCSAVWHCGQLFIGKRHHDCIRVAVEVTGIKPVTGEQGFVTRDGVFLNRENAAIDAIRCGQIKNLKYHRGDLFSEDLW